MGRELGRISGALLSENLLRISRSGATTVYNNLGFDNNLLYLNVETRRISINSSSASRDLTVPLGIDTVNLLVDSLTETANFTISTNQIQNTLSTITITPNQSSPVITTPGIGVASLTFEHDNQLNAVVDSNINLTPSGSGVINIRNNTYVDGSLHATGNITWDGDITLGDSNGDTITFKSDVNSDIVPNLIGTVVAFGDESLGSEFSLDFISEDGNPMGVEPNTVYNPASTIYDFGSPELNWLSVYANTANLSVVGADLASVQTGYIGNIKFEANNISNNILDNDVIVLATGITTFDGIQYINQNNFLYDSILTLNSTASGHVKIVGTNGMVIPVGPTVGPEGTEVGMIRYNTDLGYVRVFNGTVWQPVGGDSVTLTADEVADVMWRWDVILG